MAEISNEELAALDQIAFQLAEMHFDKRRFGQADLAAHVAWFLQVRDRLLKAVGEPGPVEDLSKKILDGEWGF